MKCQGHWPALPERYECEDENWEEHFEIGVGSEAKCTQHQQLHHLENGEQVDRPLGDPSYVVVWWVGTLKAYQFFFHVFWWRSHFLMVKYQVVCLKSQMITLLHYLSISCSLEFFKMYTNWIYWLILTGLDFDSKLKLRIYCSGKIARSNLTNFKILLIFFWQS